ncbi:MAG: transglutaminase domain-containing protein [Eubacterium sp.]|nr:transglutaminase domain-containing protein [Candidatus Colimonas fimequi]
MKFKKLPVISLLIIIGFAVLSLCACGSDSQVTDAPVIEGEYLLPELPGDKIIGNDLVQMDVSNSSDGYVGVKYNGDDDKAKLQVKYGSDIYTYNLNNSGEYMVFPFSCGSGSYQLEVYESLLENQYVQVSAGGVDVKLADETSPFLYPNNYVNYNADSKVVPLAYKVTADSDSQLGLVEDVYTYVVKEIDYDYDKLQNLGTGYLPDLDEVIDTHRGICFDYASLMCAMLRIRNIPTKLVVGYNGDVYHAWISVYISDVGWVDNAIEFDGTDWTLMDPTYAASSQRGSEADYVKNEDQYHALFFY